MRAFAYHREEEGTAVILVVGVLAVFILAFFVLAIDFAYLYVARGEAQNAADAAALAGAGKLDMADSSSMAYEQRAAREAAWKLACENLIAGLPVYLVEKGVDCDSPPSDLNEENAVNGDIVVGNWNGDRFLAADGTTSLPVNALKVRARRMGEDAVPLFFGSIIGRAAMDISRVAIAKKSSKGIAPIAVNEYWAGDPGSTSSVYPNSYFRTMNIDGTQSTNFGKPLALAGGGATPNSNPNDKGGYVALNHRADCYADDMNENWYMLPAYSEITANVSVNYLKDEWVKHLDYYPYDPPLTLTEKYLPNYNSNDDRLKHMDENGNPVYSHPSSQPSFATLAYFSGLSGLVSKMIDGGNYRGGRFAPGRDITVLVYDGLVRTNPFGFISKRTTVFGYAKVRIVGYGNNLHDAMNNPFGKNATTVYGYALGPLRECTTTKECIDLVDELSGDEAGVLVK